MSATKPFIPDNDSTDLWIDYTDRPDPNALNFLKELDEYIFFNPKKEISNKSVFKNTVCEIHIYKGGGVCHCSTIEDCSLKMSKDQKTEEWEILHNEFENQQIIAGIKNFLKRKKIAYKKFIRNGSNNLEVVFVLFRKFTKPFNQDLKDPRNSSDEKQNVCWKEKFKKQKQYKLKIA